MAQEKEFSDKVVLVTGSSSGIGETTAIEFAKLGARVVITGRNGERLKLVEEKCKSVSTFSTGKKSVLAIIADLAKDEDLKMLIDSVINGQLDVLVNNAGVATFSSIFDPNAVSTFDRIMSTNLRSVFVLTHLAIPYLIKTRGNIVNVSSVAGTKPLAELTQYCMSKTALDMLTKCLALEVGPHGVRVNCLTPGGVRTPIFRTMGIPDESRDAIIKSQCKHVPLRRTGEPIDMANVILFLASSKAVNMTGSLVLSDSGALWGPTPDVPELESVRVSHS